MSAKRVEFHGGAIDDIKHAVVWYRERNGDIAADFIEELKRGVDAIREAPHRWPAGANNTRRFLLWRFPFALIYSEQESVIVVWAVAHGSRRPGYWSRRTESPE